MRNETRFQRKRRPLALCAAVIASACAPAAASAEGLFDFLFGEPPKPQPRQAMAGSGPAFCVRSCDGRYFPLMRGSASPVQTCQAFCPASPTKVFFGSSIDSAYAANGERYADSENAFVYRREWRANCTCNGRNAAGLAPVDLVLDSSLRAGDVVATTNGLVVYSGVRIGNTQSAEFTPIAAYPGLTADVRARLGEMKVAPVSAEMIASDLPPSGAAVSAAPLVAPPRAALMRDKRAEAD